MLSFLLMIIYKFCYVYQIYDKDYYFEGYGDPDERSYNKQTKSEFVTKAYAAFAVIEGLLFIFMWDTVDWTECAEDESTEKDKE